MNAPSPTTSTSPSIPRSSNSSEGRGLTSPNVSRKNNEQQGTIIPRTGQVEKLVNEFQQIASKETNNGIPTSIHPHIRRHNRENTSSTTTRQEQHRYVPPKYRRKNTTFSKKSIKRKNSNKSQNNTSKTNTVHDEKHDIQQQFFKSLTNDLIKSGSVVLKSAINIHKQTNSASTIIRQQNKSPENGVSVSKVPLGSSPPHVLNKRNNSEDDKVFKHHLSKTLETGRSTPPPPTTGFLSHTAPAQVTSTFTNFITKEPPSPTSSPRSPRASLNSPATPSPKLARRAASPVVVLTDIAQVRAALNPVGLPLESSKSPSSSPTPSSPISPKPLRPFYSLKFPAPPLSSTTEPASPRSPTIDRKKIDSINQQAEESARRAVSPIRSHSSAFITPPTSCLQSPAAASSTSTTTPLSPSSLSTPNNWTACKPQKDNLENSPHHKNRHILSRPITAIGGVRYCATQGDSAPSIPTSQVSPNSRSASPSPFIISPISSFAPPSPTITRIPASPAPQPIPISSAASIVASSPNSLSELSSTSPSSSCSSVSNSPHTSSLDLRNVAGLVPSVDNIQPLITALSLDHNSRRSVESIPSFTDSPRESPCPSPCESPRTKAESPRTATTDSPRGWGEEGVHPPTCGWRSPTLGGSALNITSFSPNLRASMYNHHHRTRGSTTATDGSPRSSPELLSPTLGSSIMARGRLDSFGRTQSVMEMGGRSREGSAGERPRIGSIGSTARSPSEPLIAASQDEQKSLNPANANLEQKTTLTRSVSAWQLGKSSNEYGDESESLGDRTDLIFTNTRNGTRVVKAGTLSALIEVLTWQRQSDPAYVDAFLLTYASFVSPVDLLDKLIARYNQSPPAGLNDAQREEFENDLLVVRLRVCSVLKSWVDKYYYDFQKGSVLVEKFITFMESLKERGMEKVAGMIVRALYKKLDGFGKKMILSQANPPAPIIPKGDPNLFNFDDAEIARQITLMEYESYCSIKPRECLNQAWNKANKEEESPNIVTMIRRSNTIPLWVATEIIKEDKLQRRVAVLKKFISVAEHCRQLNNFNAVMEIISGLNLTPVYRLRKTWDALPKKYGLLFEQLTGLMASKGNFKVYREELHTKDPPCVPFLGLYLTDLTFIEELAKDVGEGMINFVTRMQLSMVIREIQQYQKTPYNLAFVPSIRDYLLKIYGFPEGELYTQSRMIEPPQN